MARLTLAHSTLVISLLAALTIPAVAEAVEITSPEEGAEVTSPLVVRVDFSCGYTECSDIECYETFAQALTLNVDGEPIEVREIESCSLSDTEEFELELPVGGHILSADIVYFELGWTSPEVAIEVIENPEAMTPDADIVGDDEGCGCSTGGPNTAFSLLSLLALPLVRRRRPSAGRHG